MELFIIRHAQSENNALMEDQTHRVVDPNLTEVGFQQADCLAQHLKHSVNLEKLVTLPLDSSERKQHIPHKITHLYCSAMRRSMQTARPIGEAFGLTPEIWIDIHEHGGMFLEEGDIVTGYGGMTRQQIMDEFTGYIVPDGITDEGWWNPAHGKEDIEACNARAMRVANSLHQRAKNEATRHDRVAIVVHGMFIDCLMKALLSRLPATDYFHWHYNTAITRVDFWENRLVIRYINRIDHLPPELVT